MCVGLGAMMKMEFHSSSGTLAYNVKGFVVEFVPAARGHILLTWFHSYYTMSGLQNVSNLLPEWRWPTNPGMVCVFTHVFWFLWLNHRLFRSTEVKVKVWVEWELHSVWCLLPLMLFNLIHSTRDFSTRACGSLKYQVHAQWRNSRHLPAEGCQCAPLRANALLLTLMIMAV